MTFLAARLYNTGNLLIANTIQFDETTYSNAHIANSACYAGLFDEVTGTGNAAYRITSTGTMLVAGIFDEHTGIS
jgi:hypothetical protein